MMKKNLTHAMERNSKRQHTFCNQKLITAFVSNSSLCPLYGSVYESISVQRKFIKKFLILKIKREISLFTIHNNYFHKKTVSFQVFFVGTVDVMKF